MALPEKQISKIIDKVNLISDRHFYGYGDGDSPLASDIEIAQLKREAKALPDDIDKNTLLGMVAPMEFKYEDVIKYFNLALSFDKSNTTTMTNYAVSLDHLGLFNEAKEKVIEAYSFANGDITLVNLIIGIGTKAGDFPTVLKWMNTFKKIAPDAEIEDEDVLVRMYNILESNKTDHKEVQGSIDIAMKIAMNSKAVISDTTLSIVDETENDWISYSISLRAPIEKVQKINNEFIEAMIDKFGGQPLESLVIDFSSRK